MTTRKIRVSDCTAELGGNLCTPSTILEVELRGTDSAVTAATTALFALFHETQYAITSEILTTTRKEDMRKEAFKKQEPNMAKKEPVIGSPMTTDQIAEAIISEPGFAEGLKKGVDDFLAGRGVVVSGKMTIDQAIKKLEKQTPAIIKKLKPKVKNLRKRQG